MPFTTNSKIAIRLSFSVLIAIIVIGYSIFSARHIIKGPTIVVASPLNGELTASNFVEIKGQSENLNYISLNDRQIFVDDSGKFKEKLLLYTGENVIKLYGKDKFGRENTQYIRVVAPETINYPEVAFSPPPPNTASSTGTTTKIKTL